MARSNETAPRHITGKRGRFGAEQFGAHNRVNSVCTNKQPALITVAATFQRNSFVIADDVFYAGVAV